MADIQNASSEPTFKRAHFIGIGGAGMSGIALVLHERGYVVTGSDLKTSRYIRQLTRAGVDIHVGHEAKTIDEVQPDVVVVSTAIPESNPELIRARELGIPVWPRAKMLSALGHGHTTVAVAGTHGKTTTSSMCATMLDRMGLDPSFLIGGIVEGYDTNGRNGSSEYFVCEADESDSSFLYLDPNVVVVTNVEADHLDHYGSLEEIEATFVKFMKLVGEDGTVIVCGDSPRLAELAHGTGRHNMLNACASLIVACVLGLDVDAAATSLSTFDGVRRRFTHVGDTNGICVVDDYGHHPTEVGATLKAAKTLDFKDVVVVFQPHRYSRLQALASDFADAFADADTVILIDVFSAGEMPIPGATSKMLADLIAERHPGKPVFYAPDRASLMKLIDENTHEGDLLITMGAGDVTAVGPEYLEHAQEQNRDEQ